jgi:hypothetical protein
MADVPDLEITVTPPVPGCLIETSAYITALDDNVNDEAQIRCQLLENGGSASSVRTQGINSNNSDATTSIVSLGLYRINTSPTAGAAYAYKPQCMYVAGAADFFGGTDELALFVKMTCPTR